MMDKGTVEMNPLLRRALQFLGEGDRGRADDYCEKVLDQEPENAYAYVIKLMIRLNVTEEESLGKVAVDYEEWNSYRNAYRYADDDLKQKLENYLKGAREAILHEEELRAEEEAARRRAEEEQRREEERQRKAIMYTTGMKHLQNNSLDSAREAYRCFTKILDYQDAAAKAEECRSLIDELEERERRRAQLREIEVQQRNKKKKVKYSIVAVVVLVVLIVAGVMISKANQQKEAENQKRAVEIEEKLQGLSFIGKTTEYVFEDSGMSWTLAREHTEYVTTYTFMADGQIKVDTVTYYDMEPFITRNGQRVWDSVTSSTEYVDGGEVSISLKDEVTVEIEGRSFVLNVSSADDPQSIVIGNTTYYRD